MCVWGAGGNAPHTWASSDGDCPTGAVVVVLVALVDGLHKAKKKREPPPPPTHIHAHEDNGEGVGAGYWRGASTCLSLWKPLRCSPPH